MQATGLWNIWHALFGVFRFAFTTRGYKCFVEWITALALNVEEHTIRQSLVAIQSRSYAAGLLSRILRFGWQVEQGSFEEAGHGLSDDVEFGVQPTDSRPKSIPLQPNARIARLMWFLIARAFRT